MTMKHLLVLVALFFAHVAHPAPGDACAYLKDPGAVTQCRAAIADPLTGPMFAKCALQMVQGQCEQLADPYAHCTGLNAAACRTTVNNQVETFSTWDGRRVDVPFTAFLRIRGLQTSVPTDLTMCHTAAQFCREQPGSMECFVGRASWGTTRGWGQ